ncbi:hypothetical protein [Variovorax sp. GB1P17]|uniref:hypothetical protein n=1 Tax=Variovorax sp. GB1P17 TaxID=3443740 RepID=UPI003F4502AC
MDEMAQLTGGIAHDFNNLLQLIVGNSEFLSRGLPEEMLRLRRATAQAQSEPCARGALTQRSLAFARRHPLAAKPQNAISFVRGLSELLRRAVSETILLAAVAEEGLRW